MAKRVWGERRVRKVVGVKAMRRLGKRGQYWLGAGRWETVVNGRGK